MAREQFSTVRLDDQERALLAAVADFNDATLGWGIRLLIIDDRKPAAKPARVTARARPGASPRELGITFRLGDAEADHVRARAEAAGVDASTYVRALIHAGARALGIEVPADPETRIPGGPTPVAGAAPGRRRSRDA